MPELIVIKAVRGDVRLADLSIRIRSRSRVESKLGARVVVEHFLMILYHLGGRLLQLRFLRRNAFRVIEVGACPVASWCACHAMGGLMRETNPCKR